MTEPMPTDLPLPDLDKLHAEAHPGEWTILRSSWCVVAPTPHVTDEDVVCDCEQTIDWDPETIGAKQRQWKANAEWIAQIHNTWPTISARLKEQDESVLELQEQVTALELERNERVTSMKLLEETLRGILQEKRDELASYGRPGPSFSRDKLIQQIAWLESVLGGEK
jgi:hypothetical protein